MAQHESFETTPNKIRKTWEKVEQNQIDADDLKKFTIKLNPQHFNKKLVKIPVVEGVLIAHPSEPVASNFEITFEDFPDWAVPMSHVMPVIYRSDEKVGEDINLLLYDFQYWWRKIGTFYQLQCYCLVFAIEGFFFDTVFLDISVHILNERIILNPNKNKE